MRGRQRAPFLLKQCKSPLRSFIVAVHFAFGGYREDYSMWKFDCCTFKARPRYILLMYRLRMHQ
jgi:hypothetical protein